jgi:TonB family protein
VLGWTAAWVALLTQCPAAAQTPSAATVVPPHRLDEEQVPYPSGAHGQGTVVLVLLVDAGGAVVDVRVREGSSPFAEAAAAGVRSWRFAPARRNDVAVASRIRVEIGFTEPKPPPAPSLGGVVAPPEPPPAAPTSRAAAVQSRPAPEEVSIRGEREEPSTNHFQRAETRRVAGAFGDPFRVVEALPGMAPWLSGLPYYYVRGSPPGGVGYFIDGISIPLLFHVGAGPSTMAPAFVDSVDLFPGAYPAQYGRYVGAVIAGKTRPPASDSPHAEFSVRFFDADASASTPFDAGRGTVAVGARYAYTGPLISLFAPGYALGYWDYQVRASHGIGERGELTLFAFGAFDQLRNAGVQVYRVEYHRVDLRYDHQTAAGTVRLAWTFSQDDAATADSTSGAQAARRGPGWRLRAEIDQRLGSTMRARAGADVATHRFDVDAFPMFASLPTIDGPHTDFEAGAYADAIWRPLRVLEIVPGVRLDVGRWRDRPDVALQPRLASRVSLAPRLVWLSAFGFSHQTPTEAVFIPASPPDPIELSTRDGYQLSEALELRMPARMRLRVAAYDSRVLARHVLGTDRSGEEESRGVEILFHRDLTERLGGFVSYTLARTDWTDVVAGTTGRAPWDRTHVLTAAAGYDLDRGWRVSARFFVESGRPAQSCGGAASDLPVFYRVDAKVEKQWRWPRGQWLTVSLEAFNATDQAEPIGNTCQNGHSFVQTQTPIVLPTLGLEGGL